MTPIDLRSDTVTRPTAAMRKAMAEAPVGDDVYGEDPTVNRLQAMSAERLGHEAALFVTSGTQAQLLALLCHCGRGDEYIAGQQSHIYHTEGGGGAALGGIQPQPLDFRADGTLDLDQVRAAIKPRDIHLARTRLLCLENTQAGKVLPLEYLNRARRLADEHGLALHLDGARVFNAAVKLGIPVDAITASFDSVGFCLSKGLGAPVGSLLTGSRDLVEEARRWRKMVGGGMRQAGIVAAAGIVALEQHVERLAEDHDNARLLAEGLARIEGLSVDAAAAQTNMVMATMDEGDLAPFGEFMAARNIFVRARLPMRLVTHLDVSREDVQTVVAAAGEFFAARARRAS